MKTLFNIAIALLPVILRWIGDGQKKGYMVEGQRETVTKIIANAADDMGLWNEIVADTRALSPDDKRAILTGRVREPR